MKTYKIHLIRHGKSEGNLKGQYIGITDSPLSEEGKKELEKRAESGYYPYASKYFTSPLNRCYDTIKTIYPEQTPQVIKELAECNFGDFEEKTAEELKDNPDYIKWLSGGADACPPNGESNRAFALRVCGAFEKLVEDLMKTGTVSAVCCTHGGVIMALLAAYGLPECPMHEWMTENGGGYTLRITPSIWMRGFKAEVLPLENSEGKYIYPGESEDTQQYDF